ncbi:hypothetical protein SLEP1_g28765 [Rubroshorea leprosula]|uniref:Uncharacterized protein n=1 Tax=Rubroshorea leprosula TaxID=152421 RepID=A0AAV5JUN8_9ROSI|nr:hypothetical protein SLEP1_g28765 [Rubroshorea leprosula]
MLCKQPNTLGYYPRAPKAKGKAANQQENKGKPMRNKK